MDHHSKSSTPQKRAVFNSWAHKLFLLSIQDENDEEVQKILKEFHKQPEEDEITKEMVQSVIDSAR